MVFGFMVMCLMVLVLFSFWVNCSKIKQRRAVVYSEMIFDGMDRLQNLAKQIFSDWGLLLSQVLDCH